MHCHKSMTGQMKKPRLLLYLLLIFIIASGLRCYGLSTRGLFHPDETRYYRDAVKTRVNIDNYFKSDVAKNLKSFSAVFVPSDDEWYAGKPGHSFLGTIGLYLFGNHQHSVLLLGALLSIATIFIVFLIGYRFYDMQVGLIAGAIASVCPILILFSRSFLTHSNQAFFLVLAIYLYLSSLHPKEKARIIPYLLSALCIGYAFLVHPTGVIYFMPFLLCEVFYLLKRKRRVLDVFLFIASFLIPFLVIELVVIFGREEFGSLATALRKTYIEQLLFTSADAADYGRLHNKNLGSFHYLIMSLFTNGPLFTILLVSSAFSCFVHMLKNRKLHNFVIFAIPVALFIYWQFISIHERLLREMLFLFPVICLIIAVFISKLNKKVALLLVSLLIAEGIWYSAKVVLLVKSEYPRLETFLNDNRINKVITPSEYLATTADVLMPGLEDVRFYRVGDMKEAKSVSRKEGIDYLIVLPGDWFKDRKFGLKASAALRIKEPHYAYFPYFYESVKVGGNFDYLQHKDDPNAISVTLYNLKRRESS